jgi:hypothetical protein
VYPDFVELSKRAGGMINWAGCAKIDVEKLAIAFRVYYGCAVPREVFAFKGL